MPQSKLVSNILLHELNKALQLFQAKSEQGVFYKVENTEIG